jgi:hypothetical protein
VQRFRATSLGVTSYAEKRDARASASHSVLCSLAQSQRILDEVQSEVQTRVVEAAAAARVAAAGRTAAGRTAAAARQPCQCYER